MGGASGSLLGLEEPRKREGTRERGAFSTVSFLNMRENTETHKEGRELRLS